MYVDTVGFRGQRSQIDLEMELQDVASPASKQTQSSEIEVLALFCFY